MMKQIGGVDSKPENSGNDTSETKEKVHEGQTNVKIMMATMDGDLGNAEGLSCRGNEE